MPAAGPQGLPGEGQALVDSGGELATPGRGAPLSAAAATGQAAALVGTVCPVCSMPGGWAAGPRRSPPALSFLS